MYGHVVCGRTDLWAEFVAGVSAIDKTAWVVKRLLYSFLMVQVTLSCRILYPSVSATAVVEILHMLVHRHHCTTSRHHIFHKAMDAFILYSFIHSFIHGKGPVSSKILCVLKCVLIYNAVTWILSLALQEPYHLH